MCWVTCAYNGKRGPNVCGYCMTYDIFWTRRYGRDCERIANATCWVRHGELGRIANWSRLTEHAGDR